MDVSPKLVLRSLVQVQPTYFHLIHDISCHFEYIKHSLKYSKTLVLHSFSLISDRRYQITLFIVMMLVFTIPDFATFKEEKVKSIIILLLLIILIKVLITRKEILRDDRTLPAPAITVCPYFVDNVNPEVVDTG